MFVFDASHIFIIVQNEKAVFLTVLMFFQIENASSKTLKGIIEMYVANAKILRWVPSTTFIPLACIGGIANSMFVLEVTQILAFLEGKHLGSVSYL